MGGEDPGANAREIPGEADWRAHRVNLDEQGKRVSPRFRGFPFAGSTPRPISARLERGKVSRLPRRSAVHARHSRHRLSRQAVDHAPVLRLCFARRNQSSATSICLSTAAEGCRWRSICRRSWVTTPIIRPAKAKSASAAWPSIRSKTWRSCSTASTWRKRQSR